MSCLTVSLPKTFILHQSMMDNGGPHSPEYNNISPNFSGYTIMTSPIPLTGNVPLTPISVNNDGW